MSALRKRESKRPKIDKPLAERKRRARINDALLQLKNMVLQSVDKQGSFMSKLEKADILEMTIEYINQIKQCNKIGADPTTYKMGFNECNSYVIDYLNDVTTETSEPGLRARLMKHLASVFNTTDGNGTELQIVGIIAPKTDQLDVACNDTSSVTSEPTQLIAPKSSSQGSVVECVPEHHEEKDSPKTVLTQEPKTIGNQMPNKCINVRTNTSPLKVRPLTVPKKRKVLGEISNNSKANSTNGIIGLQKGQQTERNCGGNGQILKPLKKRITERMLQSSVDSSQSDTCATSCTADFMTHMTTINRLCQSTDVSLNADQSSPTFIGFQSGTKDTCQFGAAITNNTTPCTYNENTDHNSNCSQSSAHVNTAASFYNFNSYVPEQVCFDPAQLHNYQVFSQRPLESGVWRPW